jgi:phosphate transport system ATP-binding protein
MHNLGVASDRRVDSGDLGNPAPSDRAAPARRQNDALWQIDDLSIRYGRKVALAGVSIEIERGDITAIIGPSGCGKSSFLYCLNRLSSDVQGCCVSGKVLLNSHDIFSPDTDQIALRKRIGFIFQKPNPFPLSIRRNLELPLREHGERDRTRIEGMIEATLRAVGLWREVKDRLNAPALQLSGGQQQRLCIARALVLEPEALIMDEPCSALDPMATSVIEELIRSFKDTLSVVVVTHNLRQAKRIGDRVAFFWCEGNQGKLLEVGACDQIFNAPKHELTRLYVMGGIA